MNDFERKGIILAGGKGSRLYPITYGVSKQLIPIYNKPTIYYSLTTLMLSGIKKILIITSPDDIDNYKKLLKDGSQWGIKINFEIQEKPEGIAQAFLIGENFIKDSKVALILGDNFFHSEGLSKKLLKISSRNNRATLFAYPVNDPKRFGIVNFDKDFKVTSFEEKPKISSSKYAITGLYFYDNKVIEYSKRINFSDRGELEITDINNIYLKEGKIDVEILGRGTSWIDTGTFDSLQNASAFVKTVEERQSLKIGCPEEVAWRMGWISNNKLEELALSLSQNNYGKYLLNLLDDQKYAI